jgi:16S rRNA (guanine966-N2)-methyltransferase
MARQQANDPVRHARGAQARELRIIAGVWRGRRWRFPDTALRPTPDRVRETLFNWLQQQVTGRRGLDLFAGSGALGLEALSRGAAQVQFVESDARAARALTALLQEWGAEGAEVFRGDALDWLHGVSRPFDLVFLDPPFESGLLTPVGAQLGAGGWLAPGARIYVESPKEAIWTAPPGWQALKSGSAGAVSYHLYQFANGPEQGQ